MCTPAGLISAGNDLQAGLEFDDGFPDCSSLWRIPKIAFQGRRRPLKSGADGNPFCKDAASMGCMGAFFRPERAGKQLALQRAAWLRFWMFVSSVTPPGHIHRRAIKHGGMPNQFRAPVAFP